MISSQLAMFTSSIPSTVALSKPRDEVDFAVGGEHEIAIAATDEEVVA